MGNNGDVKPSKPEKSSSPEMAYYGARFAVPPYMNSAFASPHSRPPYTWAPPQPPCVPFYSHGGVYSHPGVPLVSTSLSMEPQAKSIGNGDGNGDSTDSGTELRLSDSDETDSSSNGSNGVAQGADKNGKKRSRQRSLDRDGKARKKSTVDPSVEVGGDSEKIHPISVKIVENTNTSVELKHMKSCPTNVPLRLAPNGVWVQNERELKRERRKQANRESARRSRLRKQAEMEELAVKVEALTAENMTLKSELNKLMEISEQLKLENAALAGKVKDSQPLVGTVNLLARVNISELTNRRNTITTNTEDGKAKLRQLLDANPRTDAVIAG